MVAAQHRSGSLRADPGLQRHRHDHLSRLGDRTGGTAGSTVDLSSVSSYGTTSGGDQRRPKPLPRQASKPSTASLRRSMTHRSRAPRPRPSRDRHRRSDQRWRPERRSHPWRLRSATYSAASGIAVTNLRRRQLESGSTAQRRLAVDRSPAPSPPRRPCCCAAPTCCASCPTARTPPPAASPTRPGTRTGATRPAVPSRLSAAEPAPSTSAPPASSSQRGQ